VADLSRCITCSRRRARDERGGVLLAALIVTLLATMLVMGAAYEAGVRLETRVSLRDGAQALTCAQAGLEDAAHLASASANWRAGLMTATWILDKAIGESTVTVTARDPLDGAIGVNGATGSSSADSVELTATATTGQIARALTATYLPLPHAGLRNVVFSATLIDLHDVALEGRLRANGAVTQLGGAELHGDITTLTGAAVSSDLDDGDTDVAYAATPLTLPSVDFNWFKLAGKGITLPASRVISNTVISSTLNPFGSPSPRGIYWIDAGGGGVRFNNVAVEACLAILNAGTVSVCDWSGDPTNYYHHSPDPDRLPALLVQGDLTMSVEAGGSFVTPGGSAISSGLDGVFLCTGIYRGPQVGATAPITLDGAILANEVHLVGPGTIIRHDANLSLDPLAGLTGPGLRLVPGTTREN
jgi:hypothetical protein